MKMREVTEVIEEVEVEEATEVEAAILVPILSI
jgi:hypothetical protein